MVCHKIPLFIIIIILLSISILTIIIKSLYKQLNTIHKDELLPK